MLSLDSIVAVAGEQISSDLAGEAVILNLKEGIYYGLDDVGARIWSLIQEPRSVEQICDQIFAEYDVGASQCERDVLALLEELAAARLIEVRDAIAAPISPAGGA